MRVCLHVSGDDIDKYVPMETIKRTSKRDRALVKPLLSDEMMLVLKIGWALGSRGRSPVHTRAVAEAEQPLTSSSCRDTTGPTPRCHPRRFVWRVPKWLNVSSAHLGRQTSLLCRYEKMIG